VQHPVDVANLGAGRGSAFLAPEARRSA
jgi:hypothetical protein